jgi:DNA-directed RNA polymerase specialized sigma24 family protein
LVVPVEGRVAVPKSDSVTRWLDGVKLGTESDIQRLWDRYFERLVRLARTKLPRHRRRELDEEDVAISAFQSFCDRAGRGQFPQLSDRNDLWRLLLTITIRKAGMTIRHQNRQKRGAGNVLGESAVMAENTRGAGIAEFLNHEPTPQEVVHFTDELEGHLNRLADSTLKTIAVRKLEGHSSQEIAAELGTSARTVDRKLQLIRAIWEDEG